MHSSVHHGYSLACWLLFACVSWHWQTLMSTMCHLWKRSSRRHQCQQCFFMHGRTTSFRLNTLADCTKRTLVQRSFSKLVGTTIHPGVQASYSAVLTSSHAHSSQSVCNTELRHRSSRAAPPISIGSSQHQ